MDLRFYFDFDLSQITKEEYSGLKKTTTTVSGSYCKPTQHDMNTVSCACRSVARTCLCNLMDKITKYGFKVSVDGLSIVVDGAVFDKTRIEVLCCIMDPHTTIDKCLAKVVFDMAYNYGLDNSCRSASDYCRNIILHYIME